MVDGRSGWLVMLTAGRAIKKNSYEQPADVSLVMEALAGRSIHPSSASLLPLPLLPFRPEIYLLIAPSSMRVKLIRKIDRFDFRRNFEIANFFFRFAILDNSDNRKMADGIRN